jgi:hypothetical protein
LIPARENLLAALHEALVETGGEVVFNAQVIAAEPDGRLRFADGQLAFLSAGARTAAFKAIDASTWLKRRILLASRLPNRWGARAWWS